MILITRSRLRKTIEHSGEDFEAVHDRGQPVPGAAQKNLAAMVEPLPQGLLEGDDARHDAIGEQVHVHRKPALQLGELEKLFHHHFADRRARAGLDDERISSADSSRISATSGQFFLG